MSEKSISESISKELQTVLQKGNTVRVESCGSQCKFGLTILGGSRKQLFVIALAFFSVLLAPASAHAGCFRCPCNKKLFDNVGTCNANCRASLGCFTNICGPWRAGPDPTASQDSDQKSAFENLTDCYGVTDQPTNRYNCIAWSVGDDNHWIWWKVDKAYGNYNGVVEVSDFDRFYLTYNYVPSAGCAQESGKEKVALYGKRTSDPKYPDGWEPTHAARQVLQSIGGEGDWWESKEGDSKRIFHRLDELKGNNYGDVIKCYERPL